MTKRSGALACIVATLLAAAACSSRDEAPKARSVRDVLKPPAGEVLGATPLSTGTPLGIGVGPDGSVYYADIGIVVTPDRVGPTGTVRRIAFDASGTPQAPQLMDEGLAFPDGIGIWPAPAS